MSETANTETTEVVEPPKDAKVYDQAYVTALRNEAAAARVAKNEAVESAVSLLKAEHEAAVAAKDVAYTELQNQLNQAQLELEKLYVSVDAKVPSEKVRAFAAILKGEDKDSIVESAKATYELFGGFEASKQSAFDPTQGSGGKNPMALNGDPILAALMAAVSH